MCSWPQVEHFFREYIQVYSFSTVGVTFLLRGYLAVYLREYWAMSGCHHQDRYATRFRGQGIPPNFLQDIGQHNTKFTVTNAQCRSRSSYWNFHWLTVNFYFEKNGLLVRYTGKSIFPLGTVRNCTSYDPHGVSKDNNYKFGFWYLKHLQLVPLYLLNTNIVIKDFLFIFCMKWERWIDWGNLEDIFGPFDLRLGIFYFLISDIH